MAKGDMVIDRDAFDEYSDALEAILADALAGLDTEIWPYIQLMVDNPEYLTLYRSAIVDVVSARIESGVFRSQAEADGFFNDLSTVGRWGVTSVTHDLDSEELYSRVDGTIHRALGPVFGAGDNLEQCRDGFMKTIASFMTSEIGPSANDAMIENVFASNKKGTSLRFASVPTGMETCTFCAMLASRGFDFIELEDHHWHPGCKCRAVPGKKGHTSLSRYDPESWKDAYDTFKDIDACNDLTWEQKREVKSQRILDGITIPKRIQKKRIEEVRRYRSGWAEHDMEDVIKHLIPNAKASDPTWTGKRYYTSDSTSLVLVEDIIGGYFRIIDSAADHHAYGFTDIDGNQFDEEWARQNQKEYNRVTHFSKRS